MFQLFITFVTLIFFFNFIKQENLINQKEKGITRYRSTSAKGIAIIMIVVFHVGGEFNINITGPLGGIGVGIFAFLSGYGLQASYILNKGEFYWKKRFYSSICPYYLLELFNYILHFNMITKEDIIYDLLFYKPYYKYGWYMQFIIISYILFYFSMIISNYFKSKDCCNVIALVFFIIIVSIGLNERGCFVENRTMFFLIFLLGVLTKHFDLERLINSVEKGIIFIAFSFFLQVLSLYNGYDIYMIKLLIYTFYTVGIVCICANINFIKIIKSFSNAGKYSYFLYLVHGITIDLGILQIRYYGTFLYVLITLAVTLVSFEIFQRIRKVVAR